METVNLSDDSKVLRRRPIVGWNYQNVMSTTKFDSPKNIPCDKSSDDIEVIEVLDIESSGKPKPLVPESTSRKKLKALIRNKNQSNLTSFFGATSNNSKSSQITEINGVEFEKQLPPVKENSVVEVNAKSTPVKESQEVSFLDITHNASPVQLKQKALPLSVMQTISPVQERQKVLFVKVIQEVSLVDITRTPSPVQDSVEVKKNTSPKQVKLKALPLPVIHSNSSVLQGRQKISSVRNIQEVSLMDITRTTSPGQDSVEVKKNTSPKQVKLKALPLPVIQTNSYVQVRQKTSNVKDIQEVSLPVQDSYRPMEVKKNTSPKQVIHSNSSVLQVRRKSLPVDDVPLVDITHRASPVLVAQKDSHVEVKKNTSPLQMKQKVSPLPLPVMQTISPVRLRQKASTVQEVPLVNITHRASSVQINHKDSYMQVNKNASPLLAKKKVSFLHLPVRQKNIQQEVSHVDIGLTEKDSSVQVSQEVSHVQAKKNGASAVGRQKVSISEIKEVSRVDINQTTSPVQVIQQKLQYPVGQNNSNEQLLSRASPEQARQGALIMHAAHKESSVQIVQKDSFMEVKQITASSGQMDQKQKDSPTPQSQKTSLIEPSPIQTSEMDIVSNVTVSTFQSKFNSKESNVTEPSEEMDSSSEITIDQSRDTLIDFLEKYKSLSTNDFNDHKIRRKIENVYKLCHVTYTTSRKFMIKLKKATETLDKNNQYMHIKELCEVLRAYRNVPYYEKKVKKCDSKCTEVEKEEEILDEKQLKNKRKLDIIEKKLIALTKKIKKLEETEVDFDDEEESSYILGDELKKHFTKLDKMYCKLAGCQESTGRPHERKFEFKGSRYPEINKRITTWVNKNKEFPDYSDIYKMVKIVTQVDNLPLKPEAVRLKAIEIFQDVGKILIRRRRKDDMFSIMAYAGEDLAIDPTMDNDDLNQKFESNSKIAKKNLDKVFEEFVEKEVKLNKNSDAQGCKRDSLMDEKYLKPAVDDREADDDDDDEEEDESRTESPEPLASSDEEINPDIAGPSGIIQPEKPPTAVHDEDQLEICEVDTSSSDSLEFFSSTQICDNKPRVNFGDYVKLETGNVNFVTSSASWKNQQPENSSEDHQDGDVTITNSEQLDENRSFTTRFKRKFDFNDQSSSRRKKQVQQCPEIVQLD